MTPRGTDDDEVVLVDELDRAVGVAPKLDAHRDGRLHRAVSVFLIDEQGRLLLQRRAADKYHSPGLWSNTCCGHPRPGETLVDAAARRLRNEMGIDDAVVEEAGQFVYRAELRGGLVEHELDHVFIGRWSGEPRPRASEVSDWRWISPDALQRELADDAERFTAWLRPLLSQIPGFADGGA